MGAKTQYYEYNLPANDDYADQNKFNENFESLDSTLHNMQTQIDSAAAGLTYKGAVNYYSNLPNNAEEGDAYTVLYAGSSGTVADGTEYVWGKVGGTLQWIDFSKDSYTKAEVNGLLNAKQNTIDSSNKLNPDYIAYDSSHRAVSDTEKTTWNGKIDTNGTGLSKTGTTLNHSNSTTAQSTQAFRQVAYDAQGHITGSTAATTAQAAAINSGITSTDVAQINTNKSNISLLEQYGGGKNLFNNTATNGSSGTLSWTVASDKSVTLSGSTDASNTRITLGTFTPESGVQYVLSGCPSDGTAETFRIYGVNANDTRLPDYGEGFTFTGDGTEYTFYIYINSSGTNMTGKVFKPMICSTADWALSHDYQPYAMSNAEITAWILAHS